MKFWHVFDYEPNLEFRNVGPLPPKIGGPKTSKIRQFRDLVANISGAKQDNIVEPKTALQTAIHPAHAYLIRRTLAHKRRK